MIEATYLGHAMWLLRAAGLRLLFDPLLDETHFGGVFEVVPRRRVAAEKLAPDFIVVSHRHPDHFDVPSLRRLAALDPETVVLTADSLVARTARACGFRQVAEVADWDLVQLPGVRLLTTPSHADIVEWGVVIESSGAVVWNQVDSVLGDRETFAATLAQIARTLQLDPAARWLDLVLAEWHPLLELEPISAGCLGFPLADYAELVEHAAALPAHALVPAAAGLRHAPPYDALNPLGYPVPEARFLRDLGGIEGAPRGLPAGLGSRYEVRPGAVTVDEAADQALVVRAAAQPTVAAFRPTAIPPLRDPNLDGRDEAALRDAVDGWIRGPLVEAVAAAELAPARLCLVIVYPSGPVAYRLAVRGPGDVALAEGFDPDYDLLNEIAASQLVDVIQGRRHWGEPLLGGTLRLVDRGYRITPAGDLEPRPWQPCFLYHAIPYETAQEAVVEWLLSR